MTSEEIITALSKPFITRSEIVSIMESCGISRDVTDRLLRDVEKIARGKYITDDAISKLKLNKYIKRVFQ